MFRIINSAFIKTSLTIMMIVFAGITSAADTEDLISYQEFTLENGLRLIVHEDAKAPIVAVNIWYHVGSRNEQPGKTGYAHLFEHLMFQGSANSGGEYLTMLDEVGATTLNGTTWFDRTNYYQTVPKNALDRVLFLESDRMGHMLEAIDQDVLDEQRGVVQNEKRQNDNEPYSKLWEPMFKQLFPPNHPYSWQTIGSMEDLDAASLEDMQEWFRTYYGPNNAVLVVAGDVDAQTVLERVEHFFGDIPAGPPLAVLEEWIPYHNTERREIIQDRVPQERIYMAWPGPRWGTKDSHQLGLALDILTGGKNSRLYERLVYRDQIATDIDLAAFFLEISGVLILEMSVTEGVDIDLVEKVAREELRNFIARGPSKRELERVRTQQKAGFIRGVESIGGPGSKSDVLAKGAVYGNNPGSYKQTLSNIEAATVGDLKALTKTWLGAPPYVARIVPYPEYTQAENGADRSRLPIPAAPAPTDFPAFNRSTLANGMELIVVERPTIPVVEMSMVLNAGYATDDPQLAGQASLAMAMLDEGTTSLDALEISEQLAMLGASLGTSAGLDTASVSMSSLKENLNPSLQLFADVVQNPKFATDEIERLRAQYITGIRQEKTRPLSIALRLLPGLLYGKDHVYSQPLTGSGTEESIGRITNSDLSSWHDIWFRPNNATLIVVGDTTLADIKPRIEKLFRGWAKADVPTKTIATVESANNEVLYLVDKPQAEQSIIFASQLVVPVANPDEVAIKAMNDVFGGQFSARINMNLREEKHWSYGARSLISGTRGQRPFIAYAPVQTDKTSESLAEIRRELAEIRDTNPPTAEELQRVQRSRTLSLPGRWETNGAVLGAIGEVVSYNLPDDYWSNYAREINNLQLDEVSAAAKNTLRPEGITWVVVGDLDVIEPGLRRLGISDIRVIDAEGNPAGAAKPAN